MSINAVYEDSQGNVHESRMDGVDLTTKISIADDFSAMVNYAVGDFCYHLGTLYKCTTAHTAGAWDSTHFTATQVGDELSELKNTLADFYTIASSGTQYLGDLSANASGYVAKTISIPSGYVTTPICSVIKKHPGDTTSLQVSMTFDVGRTGNITVYLSYSTIAAVANASSDYTFNILCKKVS